MPNSLTLPGRCPLQGRRLARRPQPVLQFRDGGQPAPGSSAIASTAAFGAWARALLLFSLTDVRKRVVAAQKLLPMALTR